MKFSNASKLILLLGAVAALAVAARVFPVGDWLKEFTTWVAGAGTAGLIAFVGIYVVAAVALAPASALTLGAGFVFGLTKGFVLVSIAGTFGAAAAFLVSRHLARDTVIARLGRGDRFKALDKAIALRGGRIVFLVRLSPLFPYNILNYVLGITAVPFWRYVFASWVGMLPGTFLYVYLGHVGRTGFDAASGEPNADSLKLGFTVFGLLVTAAVTFYVTRMARRALAADAKPRESGPGADSQS